jgi:hypothetical protein
MKRILTLTVLVLCIFSYGYGQQNVRGGDFESWKYITAHNFYEPDSSIFSTLNILDTVPGSPGVTVYPCDTAHGGIYSARLVTRKLELSPGFFIKIPGVIGTLKINFVTSSAILGIPYPYGSTKPVNFSGYFKSYPLLNDSSAAVILLSKWNTTSRLRDTLAYNRIAIHGIIDSWTLFDTPVTYLDPNTTPDSLTILLTSCGGFNASNFLGSIGQAGSTALFDDVNLTGVSGFPLLLMPSVGVRLSPNPANDYMNILITEPVSNGYFEVYDAQAKLIRCFPLTGFSGKINVSSLSSGMYYYKLTEENKLLNSGTFAITK